jgi:hypothetical protein
MDMIFTERSANYTRDPRSKYGRRYDKEIRTRNTARHNGPIQTRTVHTENNSRGGSTRDRATRHRLAARLCAGICDATHASHLVCLPHAPSPTPLREASAQIARVQR